MKIEGELNSSLLCDMLDLNVGDKQHKNNEDNKENIKNIKNIIDDDMKNIPSDIDDVTLLEEDDDDEERDDDDYDMELELAGSSSPAHDKKADKTKWNEEEVHTSFLQTWMLDSNVNIR